MPDHSFYDPYWLLYALFLKYASSLQEQAQHPPYPRLKAGGASFEPDPVRVAVAAPARLCAVAAPCAGAARPPVLERGTGGSQAAAASAFRGAGAVILSC